MTSARSVAPGPETEGFEYRRFWADVGEQFPDLGIAGVLPDKGGGGSGLVTELGSELIPYLDAAIIALENDGTIQALFDEYLAPSEDIKTYVE